MTAALSNLLPIRQAAPLLGLSVGTLRRRAPDLARRGLAILARPTPQEGGGKPNLAYRPAL